MGAGKEILFNAFAMNCVGHQSPGLWRHPRDQSWRYREPEYWTELGALLEAGFFDGLFIADVLGVYDVYGGSPDAAFRTATQVPVNDPLLVVPLVAQATRHLGIGVTCAVSYEHPYPFARRMSTLDHLTRGRVGWNIVTGYLDSAARNMGETRQRAHDDRYDYADEYLDVCYKLWEGSWAPDAVVRDRAEGVFTRPGRVRAIAHEGAHFRVPGVHLCEPSPQRTPVLYQAGASSRGRAFAGRHAECVFVSGPTEAVLARYVADIRGSVREAGRDPHDVKIFAMLTAIVGRTEAEARAKLAEAQSHVDLEGALVLMSGWTGLDFSRYRQDEVVRYVENDAGRTALASFTVSDPGREWTVGEVARWVGVGGRGPVLVGSPSQVADAMEHWVDTTGLDGFNLTYVVAHETFSDIVGLLVPELQRRGRYKTAYAAGTLREKLFGHGPGLPARHHGARFRTPV